MPHDTMSLTQPAAIKKELSKEGTLSKAQQAAIEGYWNTTRARPAVPYIRLAEGSEKVMHRMVFEGMDRDAGQILLSQALGLNDPGLLSAFIGQIVTALKVAEGGETLLNFTVQLIAAMDPKDPAEAVLCMQMAVVQVLFTTQSARIFTGSKPPHVVESEERGFNRLARTFAAQMQTLKIYRSKGKQRITVKHVTVNEGGQAIVGDVNQGGGAHKNGEATP